MNIENINKLIDWLRADQGAHLIMKRWQTDMTNNLDHGDGYASFYKVQEYHPCGTAFCLGGYCDILSQIDRGVKTPLVGKVGYRIEDNATGYLGITISQAVRLFGM